MELRRAMPEDAAEVAAVHVRSWQVGYRGLLPDEYLDGLRPEDRAARYRFDVDDPAHPMTIVAVEGASVFGFATTMPARDDDLAASGELVALYVDPAAWGRGVGRALIEVARARLTELGFEDAVLWVLVGNERAQRFYERDGWRRDGLRRTAEIWGATVDEVRYRRALS